MRQGMRVWRLVLSLSVGLWVCLLLSMGPPAGGRAAAPVHVFLVVLENTSWPALAGSPRAPYLNGVLLPQASYATSAWTPRSFHSSLSNYLWLLGGQCFTYCMSDRPPDVPIATHMLTWELDRTGLAWAAYMEDAPPGVCPTRDAGPFVVRHSPLSYFRDVTGSTAYCLAHVKPYSRLDADLAAPATVPRFALIVPNVCDDGHTACPPFWDTTRQEDNWLAHQVSHIVDSPAYRQNGVLMVCWDEGTGNTDGPLGIIVLSAWARGHGYHNALYYTHASVLRTVQELLGLSPLLGAAAQANDLRDLFAQWPA